jgi:hypothetical protein
MRAVFMGDIMLPAGASILVNGTHTVSLTPGSWFASALHFWQYILADANTWLVTTYAVTLNPETRVLTVTGSPTVVVPTIPDIGWAAGSQTLTTSTALTAVFHPAWPVVSLTHSAENQTGNTTLAQDGTAYSIRGEYQRYLALSIPIDRMSGTWDEYRRWVYLWQNYCMHGRALCFYKDSAELPTAATARLGTGWALQYAAADSSNASPVHTLSRLVEHADRRDITSNINFLTRRGIPAYADDQAWYLPT